MPSTGSYYYDAVVDAELAIHLLEVASRGGESATFARVRSPPSSPTPRWSSTTASSSRCSADSDPGTTPTSR